MRKLRRPVWIYKVHVPDGAITRHKWPARGESYEIHEGGHVHIKFRGYGSEWAFLSFADAKAWGLSWLRNRIDMDMIYLRRAEAQKRAVTRE